MRFVTFLTIVMLAPAARADILNVPGDFPTIQAAVDAAQGGDEIVLAPGTYSSPVVIDRTLAVTIRSTDPADPLAVEQTVIGGGGRLIDAVVGTNESISLLFDGVTIRRDDPLTTLTIVRSIGANLELRRCIIDGGIQPAASDMIFARDAIAAPPGNASLRIIDSELTGSIGTIDLELPLTEIVGCSIDNATIGIEASPRAGQTFRLTDSTFTNLPSSFDPVIDVQRPSSPSGDIGTVVLERLEFRDMNRPLLASDEPTELRDILIERVGRDGRDAITVNDALLVERMTIRESGGIDGGIGFVQSNTIVARDVVVEDSESRFALFHITGGPEPMHLFEDCRFERNAVQYSVVEVHGGGTIRRCDFIDNTITDINFLPGAPFFNFGSGRGSLVSPSTIEHCRFVNNRSDFIGAIGLPSGIVQDGLVTIVDTEIVGNTGVGALIQISNINRAFDGAEKRTILKQCVIVGNTVGAGIHVGSTRYEQCTITSNSSTGPQLGFGDAELVNSIFVPIDANAEMARLADDTPATIDAERSVLPQVIADTNPGSITLGPLFVRTPSDGGDGFGDDPGTPDVDESLNDDFGDLRLAGASPAIDRGDVSLVDVGTTDRSGEPRVLDDPGVSGDGIDIGAYEFQGTSCLPDTNQDGMLTAADFNAWILAFNEHAPLADQNREGAITPSDFNAWILNFNGGC